MGIPQIYAVKDNCQDYLVPTYYTLNRWKRPLSLASIEKCIWNFRPETLKPPSLVNYHSDSFFGGTHSLQWDGSRLCARRWRRHLPRALSPDLSRPNAIDTHEALLDLARLKDGRLTPQPAVRMAAVTLMLDAGGKGAGIADQDQASNAFQSNWKADYTMGIIQLC